MILLLVKLLNQWDFRNQICHDSGGCSSAHQRLLSLVGVLVLPNSRASFGHQLTATNYCILQNLERESRSDSSMQEFVIIFVSLGCFVGDARRQKD